MISSYMLGCSFEDDDMTKAERVFITTYFFDPPLWLLSNMRAWGARLPEQCAGGPKVLKQPYDTAVTRSCPGE
jgi:hypothetical protein